MNIALLGYGKMGRTIEKIVLEKGHSVVFKKNSVTSEGDFSKANVALEFSTPETAVDNISKALDTGIPIISGTTGWLERYEEVLKLCESRNGSFIYASNFSVGVNLFFQINEYVAKLMQPWKEYNVAIEEIHHLEKKDAPSGTAISLANGILKHSGKKNWKLALSAPPVDENIYITAKRIADVKGTHTVDYASKPDTISISHEAHSREGFALGAILAGEWLQGKKGVYTMKDVLGL